VTRQLRAELLKQRSTQTTLGLFLAMLGLVGLAVALHVLAPAVADLTTRTDQVRVFEAGTRVAMLFAAIAGALTITAELRYGTIRPTFLVTPTRGPVLAAKLAVGGLVGLVVGLVAEAVMIVAATAAFTARGIDNQLTGGDYVQLLVGGTAAAAMWATIGLGVGVLVRNQVGTLLALCVWMLLLENLLLTFVPDAGRLAPGAAGLALAGEIADELLPSTPGILLLALYAGALSVAGWLATLRRDVQC
jgi:ABC-2 type transport system permease protein